MNKDIFLNLIKDIRVNYCTIKKLKIYKKHGFARDFGGWSNEVGIKYLNDNWREVDEVDRFMSYLEKKR